MRIVFGILLSLAFLAFVVSLTVFPFEDADIWFHLAQGRWIVEHGFSVPQTDPFSWPLKDQAIIGGTTGILWEWLTEVGMYFLYDRTGSYGIVVAKTFLIAFSFATLLFMSWRMGVRIGISVLLLTIGVAASAERFIERPEHLGNFWLVLLISLLYWWKRQGERRAIGEIRGIGEKTIDTKDRGDSGRLESALFFVIPILFLIWSNTHGSVILGLVLLWVFTFASFLTKASYKKRALLVTALSTLALFSNPYGIDGIRHALVNFGPWASQSVYLANTYEWKSPFDPSYELTTYVFLFRLLLILFWSLLFLGVYRQTASLVGFLFLLLATYLAIGHVRHINTFVLLGFLPALEGIAPISIKKRR